MKRFIISAGIGMLTLLLGAPAALYAQDEPKQPRQEEPRPEPRQESRPQEVNPPKDREQNPPKEAKPSKHEDEKHQVQEGKQEHGENGRIARPAGKTIRIPDDRFRAQFGRSHTFVVNRPVVVEGQPRFQYAGYWFVIADPWPVDWAYTDDCYIDYIDGDYFLFDLLHPGVRVVLFVVAA